MSNLIHIETPKGYEAPKHANVMVARGIEYLKVLSDSYHFLGERYFKVDHDNKKVVNVCVDAGKVKKGRPYMYGVYIIAYSTFAGTYGWRKGKYLEPITEETFENKFTEVINKLHLIKQ